MNLTPPDWTLWRSFLAVAKEGSLSAAARSLRLTQPTIGRHLDELEAALDTSLFTRSRHGLAPTEAAVAMIPHAESMGAAAENLLRVASGEAGEARGAIRLTASEMIGGEVLPPILVDFRERYPAVAIELVLSNQAEDLLRREVDIAVRMIRPSQTALVARKIGHVSIGLHAHRRYLSVHGTPRTLADLAHHAVIGFDRETVTIQALRKKGLSLERTQFALRTDSDLAQFAAIRAGFGIGGCQTGLARRHPELVPVLADSFAIDLDVWVAMHKDLRAVRRMRLMFDHLAEHLSAYIKTSGSAKSGRR